VDIDIISLGAGVQSSTVALMAKHGEITPMPVAAVFADTGAESRQCYDYLDWLESELPFPVYRVMHKEGLTKMLENTVHNGDRCAQPPLFTKDEDGQMGQLNRICTMETKIAPIIKKTRELLGLKPKQRAKDVHCTTWIGISLDEIQRMKASMQKYITHRFPLVDLRMRRGDCFEWMKRKGYPEPPRSACVYCPYHSDHEWRKLKKHDPEGWQEAIRVDELVRDGWKGVDNKLYLHRSGLPLSEVDLSDDIERGQLTFLDECDGMCGV
jgi:hypothetical protein